MPRQRRLGSAFSDSLSRAAPLVNCGGGEMNQGSTIQLPGLFLRFIGTCEVLGGLAMVLPGLLEIRTGITPLAAAGLVIIMIGATWDHHRRDNGLSSADSVHRRYPCILCCLLPLANSGASIVV